MKSIAIVCPIHEPKFEYGRRLLDSFYRCQLNNYADFYFVFSSEEDMKRYDGFERFLITDEQLSRGGGVVNKKKLWAVQKLCNMGYEYVLTVDSDFLFIRSVNLLEVCKRFFEKKTIIGNYLESDLFTRIDRCCLSHFRNNGESAKIDARIYSWLNQPCIYLGRTISDFFDKLDIHDDFNAYIWDDFDYILYAYYLILYQEFKFHTVPNWPKNVSPFSETKRFPKDFDFEEMKKENFWVCSKEGYAEIQKYRPDNEIFLVVHMDR